MQVREIVTCEVCCSHTLSVAADCYQLLTIWRQSIFFNKKTCQSVTLSSLVRKPLQQVALFCDAAHVTSSEVLDFDEFYALHQWSFHCHHDVLDEEDAECHFLILVERNRCKSLFSRLTVQTVHLCWCFRLKSDRSFIGAFLPDVFREIDKVSLYLSNSPDDRW